MSISMIRTDFRHRNQVKVYEIDKTCMTILKLQMNEEFVFLPLRLARPKTIITL